MPVSDKESEIDDKIMRVFIVDFRAYVALAIF